MKVVTEERLLGKRYMRTRSEHDNYIKQADGLYLSLFFSLLMMKSIVFAHIVVRIVTIRCDIGFSYLLVIIVFVVEHVDLGNRDTVILIMRQRAR